MAWITVYIDGRFDRWKPCQNELKTARIRRQAFADRCTRWPAMLHHSCEINVLYMLYIHARVCKRNSFHGMHVSICSIRMWVSLTVSQYSITFYHSKSIWWLLRLRGYFILLTKCNWIIHFQCAGSHRRGRKMRTSTHGGDWGIHIHVMYYICHKSRGKRYL